MIWFVMKLIVNCVRILMLNLYALRDPPTRGTNRTTPRHTAVKDTIPYLTIGQHHTIDIGYFWDEHMRYKIYILECGGVDGRTEVVRAGFLYFVPVEVMVNSLRVAERRPHGGHLCHSDLGWQSNSGGGGSYIYQEGKLKKNYTWTLQERKPVFKKPADV